MITEENTLCSLVFSIVLSSSSCASEHSAKKAPAQDKHVCPIAGTFNETVLQFVLLGAKA